MPDAIQTLITDVEATKLSQNPQPIIAPVDDFVAAMNEIETAIGGGIVPSTIVLPNTQILIGQVSGVAGAKTMSGDATLTNGGVITISALAVGTSKIAANAVTLSKLQNAVAGSVLLGSASGGAGALYQEITLDSSLSISAGGVLSAVAGGSGINQLTGDVTAGPGSGSQASTIAALAVTTGKIAAAAVTLAKIQNAAANSKLLGSGAAGSGAPYVEISIDGSLSFTGTTLGVAATGGNIAPAALSLPNGKTYKGNGSNVGSAVDAAVPIEVILDGGGSALASGVKVYYQCQFSGTISAVTSLADQSGSVALSIEKCTYAQFDAGATHPVTGDSIVASAPPSISSATKYTDSTLTGWTTSFSAGDILCFLTTGAATNIQRVTIALKTFRA